MASSPENLTRESGMNVCAWLPKKLAKAFRQHVPSEYGAASAFAVAAIEEKLRAEGAFADKQEEQLRIPPAALPLVMKACELVEAMGPAAVQAKLDELVDAQVATEAAAGK